MKKLVKLDQTDHIEKKGKVRLLQNLISGSVTLKES